MASTAQPSAVTKRSLLLRDGLIFLTLCGVTIALFLVTFFLHRSFENHREELGRRWAERGRVALTHNQPAAAVMALRTALTYEDDLPVQLLLAQALADAGHTEEAINYFLTLRESRPGDGFMNLQLARLTRRQGDAGQAIDYYRASIFGDWQGDGAQRRREVRFELADYLAKRGQTSAAKDELLIAAGNTPETAQVDGAFGDRLAAVGDQADALLFYRKSLEQKPHQRDVLAKAGHLAYALRDYDQAYRLLTSALSERGGHVLPAPEERQWAALAADAHRIPELSLSRELPASERADHILLASSIARKRLQSCSAASGAKGAINGSDSGEPVPVALQVLRSRWLVTAPQLKKRSLEKDAALADTVTQLVNDTETQTVAPCGPPQGDDALLLMLASSMPSPH